MGICFRFFWTAWPLDWTAGQLDLVTIVTEERMQIAPLKFDSAQKSDKARIAMPDARRAEAAESPEAAGSAAFSSSAAVSVSVSSGFLSLAGGFLFPALEKIPASEDLTGFDPVGSPTYTLHASQMPMKCASLISFNSSLSLTSFQGSLGLVTQL